MSANIHPIGTAAQIPFTPIAGTADNNRIRHIIKLLQQISKHNGKRKPQQ